VYDDAAIDGLLDRSGLEKGTVRHEVLFWLLFCTNRNFDTQ